MVNLPLDKQDKQGQACQPGPQFILADFFCGGRCEAGTADLYRLAQADI